MSAKEEAFKTTRTRNARSKKTDPEATIKNIADGVGIAFKKEEIKEEKKTTSISYADRYKEEKKPTKSRRVSLLMKPDVYELIDAKRQEEGAKSFNDFVNNIMTSYAKGELIFKN